MQYLINYLTHNGRCYITCSVVFSAADDGNYDLSESLRRKTVSTHGRREGRTGCPGKLFMAYKHGIYPTTCIERDFSKVTVQYCSKVVKIAHKCSYMPGAATSCLLVQRCKRITYHTIPSQVHTFQHVGLSSFSIPGAHSYVFDKSI